MARIDTKMDTAPFTSSWRTASWESDDTMLRGEDGALLAGKHDGRSMLAFNLDDDAPSFTPRARRRPGMIFFVISGAILIACLLALDVLLRVSMMTWAEESDEPADTTFSRWGQPGSGTADLSWYPTDFLRDVIPKPIHSHNDYWRRVPLFTALHQGCIGVEADVWLFDNKPEDLYVGHSRFSLQPNRTFQSLYIDPLVEILTHQNPPINPDFSDGSIPDIPTTPRGVFDMDPDQTLTLLVDVKTGGSATWAAVVAQLAPLRERGWLSFYEDGVVHTRPVTVVGTGSTPFAELVANATYRDYFYDAPLNKLEDSSTNVVGGEEDFDATNSYYASVSFGATIGIPWMGHLGAEQVERIRRQVAAAHARGLKARYWDLPSWPVGTRNRMWDLLVKEGVDMLNVDDVRGAARRSWKY